MARYYKKIEERCGGIFRGFEDYYPDLELCRIFVPYTKEIRGLYKGFSSESGNYMFPKGFNAPYIPLGGNMIMTPLQTGEVMIHFERYTDNDKRIVEEVIRVNRKCAINLLHNLLMNRFIVTDVFENLIEI